MLGAFQANFDLIGNFAGTNWTDTPVRAHFIRVQKYTCPYIWSVHFFFQKPHGIVGNASKGTFWQEILSDWQEKSVWPIRTCCRSKHMFTHMRLTHHFLGFFLFVFDKNSVWNYQFAGHDPWSRGTVRHTKHDESVWP